MTIEEFQALELQELVQDFETYVDKLYSKDTHYEENIDTWMDEYGMEHDIFERPDKQIGSGSTSKIVEQAKLGIPFQKKIVNSAVSFLFGDPVNIVKNNKEESFDKLYSNFIESYDGAKLDYHNKKLARRLFVESRVAELLYIRPYETGDEPTEENPEPKKTLTKKLKVLLLCRKNGDEIYPVFDGYGDMTAFIRKYDYEDLSGDAVKTVQKIELYTAKFYYFAKKSDDWSVEKFPNVFGKIPVIYYEQDDSEWADVQSLINRVELLISKNADTNDYFGSPAVVSKGKLKTAPEKGEVGKFFEIEPVVSEGNTTYGDIEYLTWDVAPEAMKLEYEMLKDLIFSQTDTPDLSFNNVKGIGDLSGIAMKFMFWGSLLKAKDKQEVFGENLERRNNLIKAMLSKSNLTGNKGMEDLDLSIEFQESLPQNTMEMVELLVSATGGKAIMSQETAIQQNPLVDSPQDEVDAVKEEEKLLNAIPESYGVPTS